MPELFFSKQYYTVEEPDDDLPTYTCVTCDRTFNKRELIHQHYKNVHLGLRRKLISCHYCDIAVPAHTRKFHLEKYHGIPAPSCGACGKKFAYPNQVLKHQKEYHMGEKCFQCPNCDKRFSTRDLLKKHSVKHAEFRPYKCDYCDKTFKWKKGLTTHTMIHLDDRRFVCAVCGEAFVQGTSLKYHMMRRHPEYMQGDTKVRLYLVDR